MSAATPQLDRLLALPGSDASDGLPVKAQALAWIVLATSSADLLFDGHFRFGAPLALCTAAAAFPRTARLAYVCAALLWCARLAGQPVSANHAYVVGLLLLLAAFARLDTRGEARLFLQGARWLLVGVFFWSGAKKLAFGTYFGGEYLAYQIATQARFSEFFSLLLPAEEIARLQGYAGAVGSGPYRVESWAFAALSNAIYLGEIAVAALLVWPPARAWAWLAGLGMLIGIEIVAREVFFGLFASAVLLSFAGPALTRRALPAFAALLALLLVWAASGLSTFEVT